MPSDLVSRLSETLEELERVARAAQDDGLNPEWHGRRHQVFAYGGDTVCGHAALEPVASHIARWDPQAALRLVGGIRELMRQFQAQADRGHAMDAQENLTALVRAFGITEGEG